MASSQQSTGSGYSDGSGYSNGSGHNNSQSGPVQTPQSEWGLQLSQLLSSLGQNQYKWAMDQFNRGSGITDQNIAQYMDLAGKGAGLAQDLLGRYRDVFTPLMDNYIKQAGTYNSQDRQRFMAGQAESTVGQADQQARDEAERKLQGFGINPNSGRYMDQILSSRVQDAAARAGAGTQASLNVADRGRAMTEKAAQMGQNVPGMAVNALQSAYTGVTGAENAILGMLNTGANLTQSAAPFFNAASGAIKQPSQQSTSNGQNQTQSKNQTQSRNQQQSTGFTTDPPRGSGSDGGGSGGGKGGGKGGGNGGGDGEGGGKGGGKGGGGGRQGGQGQGRGRPGPQNVDAKTWQLDDGQNVKDQGQWNDYFKQNDNMLDNAADNPDWQPRQDDGTGSSNYNPGSWDPATFAGSEGSPWWMNNGSSGSQGQIDTSDPNLWNNPQTFTGQTDQNMPPDPQQWGANGGKPFGSDAPDPWNGVDTSGTFGNIGGYNFQQDSRPNNSQDTSGGFGGNYFGQNGNYQQRGGNYNDGWGQGNQQVDFGQNGRYNQGQGDYGNYGQQSNYGQQGQGNGDYGNYGSQGSDYSNYGSQSGNSFGQNGNYDMGSTYQGGYQPQGGGNYDMGSTYQGGYQPQQPQDFTGSGSGFSGNYGYAKGGQVRGKGRPQQRPQRGGGVIPAGMSPSRGRQTDDVKAFIPQTNKGARLNVGEFVIPKDVREHKGTEFFQNLIQKSRQARLGMSGPPARAKMKPALRMRPTFNTRG